MKFKFYLRRFIFYLIPLLYYIPSLYLAVRLALSTSLAHPEQVIGNTIVRLLIFIMLLGCIFALSMLIRSFMLINSDTISNIEFFKTLDWKYKIIYHSELGYFICRLTPDYLYVYKQGFFKITRIAYTSELDPEKAAKIVKAELDSIYSKIIREQKQKEIEKDQFIRFKAWDGFLDKQSKRDEKLNQLLK